MINPISNLALFSLSMFFGIAMLVEGFLIVKMKRQILPLPSKILYWVSAGLSGKEKSTQRFAGKNTPQNLRTYAIFTLVFGTALVISGIVFGMAFLIPA